MPSTIFEFRRAVHDSPSVNYHPTEKLRIRSACFVPGVREWSRFFFLFKKSLYLLFSLLHVKKRVFNRGERMETQLFLRLSNRTPHKLRTKNPSRESPDYLAVTPIKKNTKKKCLQAPGLQTHRNYSGLIKNKTKNLTPKWFRKHQAQSVYSTKRKEKKSSLTQIAKCNLTIPSIHSRFQDTLRRQVCPLLCPVLTEQVKTGWDRVAETAAFLFTRSFGEKTPIPSPWGWIEPPLFAPGWSGWCFHRDAFDKTGTGRLACSACVPHGALRASDCQSARPSAARSAFQGTVSSLCRPAPRLLSHRQPALLLHFHYTVDPPIPLQPKHQQIVANISEMCRAIDSRQCG